MSDDLDLETVPTVGDRIDFEKLKMLVEHGHTESFLAKFFDIKLHEWKKWKKENPDFDMQLKAWKLTADEKVERALYSRAVGYAHPHEEIKVTKDGYVIRVPTIKHFPPDTAAAVFWLKNRKPFIWREKLDVCHEGEVTANVVHTVDPIDLEERISAIIEDKLGDALQ